MKKKKIIITAIVTIVVVTIGVLVLNFLNSKDRLTSEERTWINNNINNVQNINVIKDENIFSKDGKGVFYSFLDKVTEDYGIKINPISVEDATEGLSLTTKKEIKENDLLFYLDHYVLLSKEDILITSTQDLENKIIGVLNTDLEYVKSFIKGNNISFNGYSTLEELLKAVDTGYIILPRMKYLDTILSNNLNIIFHLNDINIYYVLSNDNSVFGNILVKKYNSLKEDFDSYIKKEEFSIFKEKLNIKETDVDKLLSIDYRYGFINNSPYEVIMSGTYGGIISSYLNEFSDFSGLYININKYRNQTKLVRALNRGKVDIYFDFNSNIKSDYLKTTNGIYTSASIITKKDSNKAYDSLYGLANEEVYVQNNSNIHLFLKTIPNIKINTYEDKKELFKLNNKDVVIVMDKYIFDYYKDSKLSGYRSVYDTIINSKYSFRVDKKYPVLNNLLDKYINYLDPQEMLSKGLNSHEETVKNGNVLNGIAKYIILIILFCLLYYFYRYRKSKRIIVSKRIKKDDKIRFIDDLTMLKNRAYLSDFIKTWNNNNIYPQTVIVIGLKNLQEINDKYGVTEGDKQIQACANALIKTQLDNSDLMRSDGNEFVVYSVGYSQKQIINYIHKLSKEFKKLPYDYGVEFGYSFIEDDLKTLEDALTEATQDMKNKKDGVK